MVNAKKSEPGIFNSVQSEIYVQSASSYCLKTPLCFEGMIAVIETIPNRNETSLSFSNFPLVDSSIHPHPYTQLKKAFLQLQLPLTTS